VKQQYQTPILSSELEGKIEDAIQAYLRRDLWKKWGLHKVREQGGAILLHGAPGLGKTITAYWIARKLHLKLTEISMADYGSHIPGELARNIRKIFSGEQNLAKLEKRQIPIIFLDECDAMLVSRNKLGPDMVWMLEPITALLVEIGKYPGLTLLATNQTPLLDEAVERRLIAKLKFERPHKGLRYKLWQAKWPKNFPIQPNNTDLEHLADYDLTGAQIENLFLLWAGKCLKEFSRQKHPPQVTFTVADLIHFVKDAWGTYYE